jgi:hypothetical protein
MSSVEEGARPRKISQSSRFEVERVEETELANSKEKQDADSPNAANLMASASSSSHQDNSANAKSVLKKTVKHYPHDDDFFDLDTYPTSSTDQKDQKRLLEAQSSLDSTERNRKNKSGEDDDDAPSGCFQMIYNEKNQPVSIVVNLQSKETSSYKNCVYDLKTVALYQKLIAEFLGTMLLTLYACSIGLPITEENGVPSINGIFNYTIMI